MNWPLLQNSLLVAGTTTALAVGLASSRRCGWRRWKRALANSVSGRGCRSTGVAAILVTNCWISLLGETGLLRAWLPFKIYSLGGTIWILVLLLWPITLLQRWRHGDD